MPDGESDSEDSLLGKQKKYPFKLNQFEALVQYTASTSIYCKSIIDCLGFIKGYTFLTGASPDCVMHMAGRHMTTVMEWHTRTHASFQHFSHMTDNSVQRAKNLNPLESAVSLDRSTGCTHHSGTGDNMRNAYAPKNYDSHHQCQNYGANR